MNEVTLADCPIGLFISDAGMLCLKTEYGDNNGRIDAYIVESGEFFWGAAPQTIANQRVQKVTPVGDVYGELVALRGALRQSGPLYRHKKRGSDYVLIGFGKMQAERWHQRVSERADTPVSQMPTVDLRAVAIYRSLDDGSLWVRPLEDFGDGRFVQITTADLPKLTGGWNFSPQDGTPGHCHLAQVWGEGGKALATIEPTEDPAVASDLARLIAAAPELLHALETALPVLEATQRLMTAEAAKRGMEPDDALLNRMRAAIAKATP